MLTEHQLVGVAAPIASRMARHWGLGEDGAQTILLQLWWKRDAFVEGNVEHWVAAVGRHVLLNMVRHKDSEARTLEGLRAVGGLSRPVSTPEDTCYAGEVARRYAARTTWALATSAPEYAGPPRANSHHRGVAQAARAPRVPCA